VIPSALQLLEHAGMKYAAAMAMHAETKDFDQAIASFRAGVAAATGEELAPRGWSVENGVSSSALPTSAA
jgi:hypothetical protein